MHLQGMYHIALRAQRRCRMGKPPGNCRNCIRFSNRLESCFQRRKTQTKCEVRFGEMTFGSHFTGQDG